MLENFKKAIKEVFSLSTQHDLSNENNQKMIDTEIGGESTMKQFTDEMPSLNAREGKSNENIKKVADTVIETSFITESTIIRGNITTDSNIKIAGEVEGDIESKNSVFAIGKVHGDINCKDVEINGAHIIGKLNVHEMLTVKKDSIIVGDLSAKNGKIVGKIKGNVVVDENIEILKDAFVYGDITAKSISIEKGAVIQGNLIIQNEEAESDFEDV